MPSTPVYSRLAATDFNGGKGDPINVGHSNALNLSKGTISLGFTMDTTMGQYALISKDSKNENEGEFTIWVKNGQLRVTIEEQGETETLRADDFLVEPGQEYHLAMSFGPEGLSLWVNGDLVGAEAEFKMGLAGNPSDLVIGGTRAWTEADNGPHSILRGAVSNVEIYNQQLNEGDIMDLAEAVSPQLDDMARMHDMMDTLAPSFAQAHHGSLTFQSILEDYGVSAHGHMMMPLQMSMGDSSNDNLTGTDARDGINGMMGNDVIDGGGGNDVLQGYYGKDTLLGGAGDDILDGGHGEDSLVGGAGNDLLISRSDAREPDIANVPGRDEGDPYNELTNGKLYPDQPHPARDVLVGGAGADIFYFQTLINAKKRYIQEHTRDDGNINWHGVAGENDKLHDHWVDALGDDYVMDFSRAEGDRLVIEGHTTEIQSITYGDADGDGLMDHSIIKLYSDQGANGGAHQYDQLGTITVFGDLITMADIEHTAAPAYGIITSIEDLQEAIKPKIGGTPTGPIAPPTDLGSTLRFESTSGERPAYAIQGTFNFIPEHRAPLIFQHSDVMNTSQGTFALTFNATNLDGQDVLFSKDASGKDGGGHITAFLKENGDLVVRMQSEDKDYYLVAQGAITAGVTYDLVVNFGPGSANLYLDGTRLATISGMDFSMTGNDQAFIVGAGGWWNTPGETDKVGSYFDGMISNVMFYTDQLDGTEVPSTSPLPPDGSMMMDFAFGAASFSKNSLDALVVTHDGVAHVVPDDIETLIFSDLIVDVAEVELGGDTADTMGGTGEANVILGYGGTDDLDGEAGDDLLQGGTGADTLRGGDDNDTLFGNSSDDELHGDAGDDVLSGGDGDDALHGGAGDDMLIGHAGADTLYGDAGDDLLRGSSGTDSLDGGAGNDTMHGGTGADTLNGQNGNDVLYGNQGADSLNGDSGNDALFGGSHADVLNGGAGADSLWGNQGNDTLDGGAGNDFLRGGTWSDTFVFSAGHDIIDDFSMAEDALSLSDELWGGGLTAQQVVDQFGEVVNGNFVFDFGNGQSLTLNGLTDQSGLADLISFF